LVKQRRALLESNPPRNSQLQLIEADERWGRAQTLAPSVSSPHRIDRLLMPQKLKTKSGREAAS